MANVKLIQAAASAFEAGFTAMRSAHANVDRIITRLGELTSSGEVNIDWIVLYLGHHMAGYRQEMLDAKAVTGVDALAQAAMGDPLFAFSTAIDETVARIDAVFAWLQSTLPIFDDTGGSTGKKWILFWQLNPDSTITMNTVTKAQLVASGLPALLQGFVDDRV